MNTKYKALRLLTGFLLISLLSLSSIQATEFLVKDQDAYFEAVSKAKPGDVIKLANGTWRDFEILFTGNGKKNQPIRLTAETKGKVILSGQSNLRLAGNYLEVSGLVFRDGYTPTQEVISFRQNKENLANHSRVTEVVIDNYNQPERQEADFWVMMYGQYNRFDHNHLVGKRNRGVTMAVRLDSEESRNNYHRIDHNYFGPRPILGSNGGETIRIGTSHHSLTKSFTTVGNNYFDRCDGELEIISNKSGRNIFRNNTFFESRGTLTMRHGSHNLIEGNVFFGNDVEHTGGIRVINEHQTVRNNYLEGIKGTRFGGAFVVMNGVPDSPINRYNQVDGAVMENNSIINSDNIQLAAGSDAERSAVPINSRFAKTLIFHKAGQDLFTVYDDVSGIAWRDNIMNMDTPDWTDGFTKADIKLKRGKNKLLYPPEAVEAGVSRDLEVTQKDDTGVSWYPKTEPNTAFGVGKKIIVKAQEDALYEAVKNAQAGDVLLLEDGKHRVRKFIKLDKPVTIKAEGNATLTFERSTMFEIHEGGSLQLSGVTISGEDSPDYAGNSVIRTHPYSMLKNYRIDIQDSHFLNLDKNHSFNVLTGAKGTFADYIRITNSHFKNITGSIVKLDREIDDYGIYNGEYLDISKSSFHDVQGALADYYRGGRDESTFGPHFTLVDSTLRNVGNGKRNKNSTSLYLHGVQVTHIAGNRFEDSAAFLINHTVGEPKTTITANTFVNMPAPRVAELNSGLENTAKITNNVGLN